MRRPGEQAELRPADVRPGRLRQRLRNAAEARADGRHVEIEQPHGQRAGDEADDGAWHVPQRPRQRARAGAPEARPGPDQAERGDGERDGHRVGARRRIRQRAQLEEEIRRQLVDLQPEEILELRQDDEHGDAVGEADDDGDRNEAHQVAEPERAHQQEQAAGQHGGEQQVGDAVALDDGVHHHHESAGRSADLHARAAQRGHQEAGHDGGEEAGFGLEARRDGEGQRQRQGNRRDRQSGREVGGELAAVVASQLIEQARPEAKHQRVDSNLASSLSCRRISLLLRMSASLRLAPIPEAIARSRALSSR